MHEHVEIILYVSNLTDSREFYSALLQLNPVTDVPGMVEFVLNKECKLGLMQESGIQKIIGDKLPDPASGNGIPRAELYLFRKDAEAIYQRGIELGALTVSEYLPRDWGHTVGYIADRDGHVIALAWQS